MSIIGDMYEGGGAKPVSWADIGQTVEGTIAAIRTKQLPQFGTQTPEVWPDGSPKMTPIVTVQTTDSVEEGDDGQRDIYLRGGAFTAFRSALQQAYETKPTDSEIVGSTLKMRFASTAKSSFGSPRKVFQAHILPRSAAGAMWDDSERQPGDEPDAAPFVPHGDEIF